MSTGREYKPQSVSIVTFRDAVGLAMALADEYAFANALALIDESGAVIELGIVEGIGQTIEPLIRWVACHKNQGDRRDQPDRADTALDIECAVMMSVRPYEVDMVREEDIRHYRHASWVLAAAGIDLRDWIETDGDLFRSYAYLTCPARAWEHDPPDERHRW